MEKADSKKFKELVQALGANFRAEVTTPLLQAMWIGLSDLPLGKVTHAVQRAMRECEFMPPVARLRELAGKGKNLRPYHLPYSGLSPAEKKQIQGTWEAAEKIPGGAPPVHVGELIGHFMKSEDRGDT